METYYSVRRDEDYLPVPPLLVSVSGLENYLSALSKQLGRDIYDVKKYVETSCAEVNASTNSVNKIKRYLATKAINEMDGLSQAADSIIAPYNDRNFDELFKNQNSNQSEKDLFDGMMSIAGKLIGDNTKLLTIMEENTAATNSFVEFQKKLVERLEEVNRRMEQQQRDLHELSVWLGTYDNPKEATKPITAAEGSNRPGSVRRVGGSGGGGGGGSNSRRAAGNDQQPLFEGAALRVPSDEEIESYITRSPLLLAFRRILIRDMTERMTHSTDVQAKEMGTVVSGLKDDISQRVTSERVVDLLDNRRTNETQNLVFAYGKRLKEIENNYVRREEFNTSMRTKADTLLLPVKADSAEVTELEKRLFNKYADLEERVAYFEAEREEFRNIVRSFVNMQQSLQGPLGSVDVDHFFAANAPASSSASVTQDRKDTSRQGHSFAVQQVGDSDPRGVENAPPVTAVEGKQVYRVIGANRTTFATTAGSAAANSQSHDHTAMPTKPPPGNSTFAKSAPPTYMNKENEADASGSGRKREIREAVGLTANQAAYANFVTKEINKSQVEALPPLPYEKMSKKQ